MLSVQEGGEGETKEEYAMAKAKPVHESRLGKIRAAVWGNETENGTRYNVTFSRLYKDEGGNWKDSTSFSREDLPLLMKVADQVHTWLYQQNGEKPAKEGEGNG
jgi:hypothetical protein